MIHGVVMQISAASTASRRETFGQHPHHRVKIFARKIPVGIRAPNRFEERILGPFFGRHRGHDLLRENIERLLGNLQSIEFAAPN